MVHSTPNTEEPDVRVVKVHNMLPGFICQGCGAPYFYSPILMPKGRPKPLNGRPGLMKANHVKFCASCVKKQIDILLTKIECGEMFPTHVWDAKTLKLTEAIYQLDSGELIQSSKLFPQESEGG